jgi:apyrase
MGWAQQLGLLASVLIVLGSAGMLACFFWSVAPPAPFRYGLMIDAGSSGTRLYVYLWLNRTGPAVPALQIPGAVYSAKIVPGIGSFVSNASAAGTSLLPLLAFARQQVPSELYNSTPIFLKATAGMRELNNSNPVAAGLIMKSVNTTLSASGFLFGPDSARIIPGTEEAISTWLTVNSLSDRLGGPANETLGDVEMGGASLQVAVVPPPGEGEEGGGAQLWNVTWGTTAHYPVWVNSWLGFGGNDAYSAVRSASLPPGAGPVASPCLNPGYSEMAGNRTVSGSGNFSACFEAALAFASNMTQGAVPHPRFLGPFVAVDTWVRVAALVAPAQPNLTLGELEAAGTVFCALNYSAVLAAAGAAPPVDLPWFCFKAAYMAAVAETLDLHHKAQLLYLPQIAGEDVSWTVGAMLLEILGLPWDTVPGERLYIRHPYFLVGSAGLLLVALILLALILYSSRSPHSEYAPLNSEW